MLKIRITPYGYGTLIVKFSCSDSDSFRYAVESFKGHLNEHERRYDADGKRWIISDCTNFEFWVEYAEENLCADVEDSRRNYQQQQRQNRREEYKAPERPRKEDQLSKAFKELFLLPEAPLRVARAVHKELVKTHHPDIGGDVEKMKRVNAAYDAIEKRLGGSML